MGKSYTIHCVGVPVGSAMSRKELCQETYKYTKLGYNIEYWVSQTKVGDRILKLDGFGNYKTTKELVAEGILNYDWLVVCPICEGAGHNGKYYCPVYSGSGLTTKGYEKGWANWQLESMRQRKANEVASGLAERTRG